ncbi:hypothetical protein [Paraburkholderia heleia]
MNTTLTIVVGETHRLIDANIENNADAPFGGNGARRNDVGCDTNLPRSPA